APSPLRPGSPAGAAAHLAQVTGKEEAAAACGEGPRRPAMSASAVFILDLKGKPLISRNYKGDVSMAEIEHFMALLLQREEEGALAPLLTHGKVHFLWIKHANLYLVAATKKNANASLVYAFLYKVVEVFSEYFKELEEESIRDNFVIVYELLDELMDFGFPQTTDSKILQEYITQEGNKLDTGKSRVPTTVTNAVSWRSEGIKYKKNEVFIDVIESVNLLVSANGSVLLSEVVGTIKLKVFLSGMPELRLGLNDRVLFELTGRGKNKSVELEDVKFHQCVRLSRFDNDRTISFVPPDGDFELMSYRLNTQVKPLIWIESVIEKFSHSRVEIMVKAKGQFKKQSVANGVEIAVPVPSDADSPKFKTSVGSAKYLPEKNVVIWTIKSFPGGKEHLMRAHFGLPSVEKEEDEGRPPISVRFEIPYFTVSGIQVPRTSETWGWRAGPWRWRSLGCRDGA
uniref:AP-1 complex subunit mu-2 n=1 Tax=Apteryx owenii TaxID=8824 RepID=A0A8B9QK63_APTOW